MTERIDHVAEAQRSDEMTPEQWVTFAFGTNDASNIYMATQELKHATLALVEQQRIANLIALGESGRATVNGARAALAGLYDGDATVAGSANMSLHPEIAAALGLEQK